MPEEILIPPKRTSKIHQIIKRMRWTAFFHINGIEENTQENYDLKLLNSQPKSNKWYPLKKIYEIL